MRTYENMRERTWTNWGKRISSVSINIAVNVKGTVEPFKRNRHGHFHSGEKRESRSETRFFITSLHKSEEFARDVKGGRNLRISYIGI